MTEMTQDEIIRSPLGCEQLVALAREAGLGFFRIRDSDNTSVDALERFAALVAAHEREACAKVCENLYKHLNYDADCQKLWPHTKMINDQYAAAIRNRSDAS